MSRLLKHLLSWKHSGFSIDNTVRIYGNDNKAREALSQYIAKPPVSLEKDFDALDFIAQLTSHIPPKGKQYIRRYGLYSSRTRGIWKRLEYCTRLAPQGWREKYLENPADSNQLSTEIPECPVEQKVQKSTWARLIEKVYGTDPLICNRCGVEMRILAVITDHGETEKILKDIWLRSVGPLAILTRLL